MPERLPETLHWFRFEAAFTWLSGMALLLLVYYAGGLLVDEGVADIKSSSAAAIGLALLVLGWLAYDWLCRSRLGHSGAALGAAGFALLLAAAFGLTRVLSRRAAYMHVGALLGTLMAANVWLRILPAQRLMVAVSRQGGVPDQGLASQAKLRSKHNTYVVVPLVLVMLSNHFPTISYGHAYNWLLLGGYLLLGFAAAGWARER